MTCPRPEPGIFVATSVVSVHLTQSHSKDMFFNVSDNVPCHSIQVRKGSSIKLKGLLKNYSMLNASFVGEC